MRKNSIKLIILTNLILIIAFYAVYLARSYPFIGHDFRYFVPRLLDTYLHYRLNGPGIQWYTPTFGGGLPAYANPQHMQYSLPQLLLLAVNPWSAILISMAVFLTAGFLGAYYLSRHILHLHWTASVLGALFFTINGFYIQHLSVGHLTYIVFPIFILIIILLLDAMTPNLLAGICISLVLALTVYAGGFYVAVAYTLSTLITLPLLYLLRPRSFGWQSIFVRLALAALLTLLLTGSKIYAVTFFMRQFPRETREVFDVSMPRGIIGILSQLLGTTSLGPFFYLLTHRISEHFAGFKIQGDNAVQWLLQRIFRTYYSIWETDISMSPAVWILLVWAVVRLAKQRSIQTLRFTRGQILAGIALLASTWLTVEFVLAKGFIYPVASQMIFLRSLHTNIRYTVAFVLPLSILAAWIFHLYKKAKTRTALILFGILNVFTFVALGSYFLTPVAGYSFNISNSSRVYEGIREGDHYAVQTISDASDSETIPARASNIQPYEVIFGYNLSNFFPKIKLGSVYETDGQYYNMTNPASLVYPETNQLALFEKIAVSDKANLDLFVQRKQPNWKRPAAQYVADWLALLTLLFEVAVLLAALYGRIRANRASWGRWRKKPAGGQRSL